MEGESYVWLQTSSAGCRILATPPLPTKLATSLSTSSAIPPLLSKAVLCHLSFCFALRLSKLSVRRHLSKPVWIRFALCSSACIQMTSPSFLACTHFLIILKVCFTPAPLFFPHRSSQLVLLGPKGVESFQSKDAVADTEVGKAWALLISTSHSTRKFLCF